MAEEVSIPVNKETIRPLIKWTGGKFREFSFFEQLIPAKINRYIEPFAGGAGVFFALQPKGKALLNDKSSDLIDFYKALNDPDFERELRLYAQNWEAIKPLVKEVMFDLSALFVMYRQGTYDKAEMKEIVFDLVDRCIENHPELFEKEFCIDPKAFILEIKENLYSKFTRVLVIEQKEKKSFPEEVLADHIETAIKSGFYLHFRNVMNENRDVKISTLTTGKRISNWYVVRELCYASMFRFNAKGEFNIPYGGIAYNKKNLEQKVSAMFSKPVKQLLEQVSFSNLDFDAFFKMAKPQKDDFIFLDPPYDSEFSEYDNMSFTKRDQERLADTLFKLKANWMLVIKNTPFIFSLYDKQGLTITAFDKTYTYNVRGRNLRQAEHLIIMNYDKSIA